jgi:hypothetical protein
MKRFLVAIVAPFALSQAVLAQTTPSADEKAPSQMNDKTPAELKAGQADKPARTDVTTQGNTTAQAKGLQMADSATLAVQFVTMEPADFRASRLIGADVYNNEKEEVGEIVDISLKDGKTISAVIVSVGGFLGLGESYVALAPNTVVLSKLDEDSWAAYVDTSKDDLRDAPKVQYKPND